MLAGGTFSPAPGLWAIRQTTDTDGVVIAVNGELDLSTAPELDALLRQLGNSDAARTTVVRDHGDAGGLEVR